MSKPEAAELERRARELFKYFESLDQKGMLSLFTDDIQGIDEISRKWMRGTAALKDYFALLEKDGVSNISSKLTGFHTEVWGAVGVVTFMADQTYTMKGAKQKIHAPVTLVFRRMNGEWRIALVHAVPLPAAA